MEADDELGASPRGTSCPVCHFAGSVMIMESSLNENNNWLHMADVGGQRHVCVSNKGIVGRRPHRAARLTV